MDAIISAYLEQVQHLNYPNKKEWFSKFNFHGMDFDLLLTYKKEHLKSIPLPTQTNSLYFNEMYILPKVKSFYDKIIQNFDQLISYLLFSITLLNPRTYYVDLYKSQVC